MLCVCVCWSEWPLHVHLTPYMYNMYWFWYVYLLISLYFHTLRSVESLTPLILWTFYIILETCGQTKMARVSENESTFEFSPPVICLSLPMLLSKDIQLYPLCLESHILLVPARLYAFVCSPSFSRIFPSSSLSCISPSSIVPLWI